MANTYTVTIDSMRTLSNPEGFVTDIDFTVSRTDGTHTATIRDNLRFSPTENQMTTPYSSLTQAEVLSWINEKTQNLINHYANVDNQIYGLNNPPVVPVATALPW